MVAPSKRYRVFRETTEKLNLAFCDEGSKTMMLNQIKGEFMIRPHFRSRAHVCLVISALRSE